MTAVCSVLTFVSRIGLILPRQNFTNFVHIKQKSHFGETLVKDAEPVQVPKAPGEGISIIFNYLSGLCSNSFCKFLQI